MGWKLFSSHHDKAAPWIVPHIIHSNPETYEQFVDAFMHQRDPVLLDSLKQLSIYCGCYGNCHWADPREKGSVQEFRNFVAFASLKV